MPSLTTISAAGMISLAVAVGVGRFAFTPLFPLMVRDGLLASNTGALLAASNYLGYLLGAMLAARVGLRPETLLRLGLVGIVIVTAAVGWTSSLTTWTLLRCLAGAFSAWSLVGTTAWAFAWLALLGRPNWAGAVFAGVGIGIAGAGVFCVLAARPGILANEMWIELAMLACVAISMPLIVSRSGPTTNSSNKSVPVHGMRQAAHSRTGGLVVCYSVFGFGYILPATYLPALARQLVDDPRVFGWAWPTFGIAAALSTVIASWGLQRFNRVQVWAASHALMAAGVLLPCIWRSITGIVIAALLVGGTFMVISMVGMQEARARAGESATTILAQMTAGFAFGQLVGPVASAAFVRLTADASVGLSYAMQLAAAGLMITAMYLGTRPVTEISSRSIAMNNTVVATATPQGFGDSKSERLPIPERSAMNDAQRAAADAIINGPRKGIFGPFIPLLQTPVLMERIGKLGEALRFESTLPDHVRELVICMVARETGNQFEWQTHASLAMKAGEPSAAIDALAAGRRPRGLKSEEACAFDFVGELVSRHGVCDETYAETISHFGEAGVVELTALVGYFVMVCWIMNVARTPGVCTSKIPPLLPFPS